MKKVQKDTVGLIGEAMFDAFEELANAANDYQQSATHENGRALRLAAIIYTDAVRKAM